MTAGSYSIEAVGESCKRRNAECERQTNKVETERDRVSISLGKFGAKMIKRCPWQYACLCVNTSYQI